MNWRRSRIKRAFYRLTGGRPMVLLRRHGFMDTVALRMVYYWKDRSTGRVWMAHRSCSWFRVLVPDHKGFDDDTGTTA